MIRFGPAKLVTADELLSRAADTEPEDIYGVFGIDYDPIVITALPPKTSKSEILKIIHNKMPTDLQAVDPALSYHTRGKGLQVTIFREITTRLTKTFRGSIAPGSSFFREHYLRNIASKTHGVLYVANLGDDAGHIAVSFIFDGTEVLYRMLVPNSYDELTQELNLTLTQLTRDYQHSRISIAAIGFSDEEMELFTALSDVDSQDIQAFNQQTHTTLPEASEFYKRRKRLFIKSVVLALAIISATVGLSFSAINGFSYATAHYKNYAASQDRDETHARTTEMLQTKSGLEEAANGLTFGDLSAFAGWMQSLEASSAVLFTNLNFKNRIFTIQGKFYGLTLDSAEVSLEAFKTFVDDSTESLGLRRTRYQESDAIQDQDWMVIDFTFTGEYNGSRAVQTKTNRNRNASATQNTDYRAVYLSRSRFLEQLLVQSIDGNAISTEQETASRYSRAETARSEVKDRTFGLTDLFDWFIGTAYAADEAEDLDADRRANILRLRRESANKLRMEEIDSSEISRFDPAHADLDQLPIHRDPELDANLDEDELASTDDSGIVNSKLTRSKEAIIYRIEIARIQEENDRLKDENTNLQKQKQLREDRQTFIDPPELSLVSMSDGKAVIAGSNGSRRILRLNDAIFYKDRTYAVKELTFGESVLLESEIGLKLLLTMTPGSTSEVETVLMSDSSTSFDSAYSNAVFAITGVTTLNAVTDAANRLPGNSSSPQNNGSESQSKAPSLQAPKRN
jgi:hypothetical protein